MSTTLDSLLARYEAINSAPQHKVHTVLRHRVDTWFDPETKSYIAAVPEMLTQGGTEEEAVAAAESVIRVMANYALYDAPQGGQEGKKP